MQCYFIDTYDGRQLRDREGVMLDGYEAARQVALTALSDLAGDEMDGCDRKNFKVSVRDANGKLIFQAALFFAIELISYDFSPVFTDVIVDSSAH